MDAAVGTHAKGEVGGEEGSPADEEYNEHRTDHLDRLLFRLDRVHFCFATVLALRLQDPGDLERRAVFLNERFELDVRHSWVRFCIYV